MTAKKKKNGRQNYDWDAIKIDYVTHPGSSLRQIAEKYDIRVATVSDRSKAENWFATKKKYQSELVAKALTKACTKNVNILANEIRSAELLSDHAKKALEDPDQFHRYIVQEGSEGMYTSVEKVYDKTDTKAMKEIAATLKAVEELKRSLNNIQKAEALNKQQIERERLELEKARFEFEKEKAEWQRRQTQQQSESEKYGVVLIPEVIPNGD